jgi:hypothetical protein
MGTNMPLLGIGRKAELCPGCRDFQRLCGGGATLNRGHDEAGETTNEFDDLV